MDKENSPVNLLSQFLEQLQGSLFRKLDEVIGPLTAMEQRLVTILELVRIEEHVPRAYRGWRGRPEQARRPFARAFVAKAVLRLPTTRALRERLLDSPSLRCLCGWEHRREVPSEASFSRVFGCFALTELPQRVHTALIQAYEQPRLVGHISRDATAIGSREKATRRTPRGGTAQRGQRRKERPRAGERRHRRPRTFLQHQTAGIPLPDMLAELPRACDWGCHRLPGGHSKHWKGYKLHVDWADGEIPVSCLLTSASLHESQVAIPLAMITSERVTNLYDVMDSAYDAQAIIDHSMRLGHVPIVKRFSRQKNRPHPQMAPATARRYDERTTAERGFSRLHDDFGGRTVRVRGHVKVMAHLMFGIIALAAEQVLRLTG